LSQQYSPPAPGRRQFLYSAVATIACSMLTAGLVHAEDVRHFDLDLKAGELPRDQRTLRVKQDEAVELRWTSDRPLKLHLHGYDLELAVKPGEPAVMAFKAKIAGRFSLASVAEAEKGRAAHQHGPRVLYLEVHP
jgi:hypothetical protein